MITSSHNPKIQQVRALLTRRRERDEARAFVVEGVRLVEEALAALFQPELVLFTSALSERGRSLLKHPLLTGCDVEEIPLALMESLSGTEAPQGILAVLTAKPAVLPILPNFVIIGDGIRDPGNLGTMLRSAAAAGAQAVLLAPNCTDAYAPKVLRAGMGAHFRIPVLEMDWQDVESVVHQPQLPMRVFLAESGSGKPCWLADFRNPVALLIGGEAEGASEQGRLLADEKITIPMPGGAESLNAAVAASILFFEVVRQRNL